MLNKKIFSERLLRAFATVIRNVAPVLSCNYFTQKVDRYGYDNKKAELFIPSLKAQQKAYKRMTTEEAQAHKWSKGFRLLLLRNRDLTLLEDITSQEELEVVLQGQHSTELCALAVRRCTPKLQTLEKFMNLNKDNFIKHVPFQRLLKSYLPKISGATVTTSTEN